MSRWQRRQGAALVLVAAAVVLAAAATGTWSAFSSTTGNPGNTLAAAAAWTTVQTGTLTINSNGGTNTVTVPISSVDPAKSFLIFQSRHNGNRPVNSMVRGRIASATSVEFVRVSNEAAPGVPINLRWYVVQIPTGVRVQRGQVAQTARTINVPITPVASAGQAFVTWSKTPAAGDQNWSQDDPLVAELTGTSNLQLRVNSANAAHVIWWQVVEFTNPADVLVQKGTTSLLGATTSTTATLGTPVNPAQTFLLVGFRTAGTGADVGRRMLRARLTDSTTITIDRSAGGDDITEIVWQAVELRNGSSVQRGNASFAGGQGQATAGISAVSTGRSVALSAVQPVGGQNMGRSPYAADDVIGVCSVTMALSSTQVTMDRNNTAAACDVGWFVVEFAP